MGPDPDADDRVWFREAVAPVLASHEPAPRFEKLLRDLDDGSRPLAPPTLLASRRRLALVAAVAAAVVGVLVVAARPDPERSVQTGPAPTTTEAPLATTTTEATSTTLPFGIGSPCTPAGVEIEPVQVGDHGVTRLPEGFRVDGEAETVQDGGYVDEGGNTLVTQYFVDADGRAIEVISIASDRTTEIVAGLLDRTSLPTVEHEACVVQRDGTAIVAAQLLLEGGEDEERIVGTQLWEYGGFAVRGWGATNDELRIVADGLRTNA